MKAKKSIKCPNCGKANTWRTDNPYRPFCCERCKLIDLGEWAKESYRIESEEKPESSDEDSNN